MSTKNQRINVTFEEETASFLTGIAYKESKSVASLVRELVLEALETREDLYFLELAEKRTSGEIKIYSHEEVWKKYRDHGQNAP